MGRSLLEHMRTVPDYRCAREKPHDHAEMLAYLVAGYLNGRASVGRALCWCEDNIEMLKKHMTLKKGIASEATISRMLNGIDTYMFMYSFMEGAFCPFLMWGETKNKTRQVTDAIHHFLQGIWQK